METGQNQTQADSVLRQCAGCGRRFVPTGRQRYCSHECYSGALRVPIEQRFWDKVNKNGPVPAHMPHLGPCWLWTGATIRGYGQIMSAVNGKKRPVYAHRVAWELAHGPIPAGLSCLHKCDEPLCQRVEHLFLGTQQENLTDARQKGRLDESRPRTTSVLTPALRQAIYDASAYRGIVVDFARQYGVSKACISLIRRGRFTREHVRKIKLPKVAS